MQNLNNIVTSRRTFKHNDSSALTDYRSEGTGGVNEQNYIGYLFTARLAQRCTRNCSGRARAQKHTANRAAI